MLLTAAIATGVAGIAVLRLAWSRPRRSVLINGAGWALVLGGIVGGGLDAGAWGSSVVGLWQMAAAFALLTFAAVTCAPGKAAASNRRVGMMPEAGEPLRIAGRFATFALVVLGCALLGLGTAFAASALVLWLGGSRADAYAIAFFTCPLAWAILAYAVLMQPARRGQFKVLALASIPTWPVLAAGIL